MGGDGKEHTPPWRGEVDLPEAGRVGVTDRKASPHPVAPSLASRAKLGDPPPPGEVKTLCWLALEPLTGRTHQLRVHCAAMGWPILGDAIYGTDRTKTGHCCICTRGKSLFRSTKIARRSASSLQSLRICVQRSLNAAGATTKLVANVVRYPLVQRLLDPAIRVGSRLVQSRLCREIGPKSPLPDPLSAVSFGLVISSWVAKMVAEPSHSSSAAKVGPRCAVHPSASAALS